MTLETDSPAKSEEKHAEYDFEPYSETSQDITLWQAARATSGAPLYFKPLRHHKTEYWDGSLYFNNPAHAVKSEVELLWPGRRPDLLLSVGDGFKPKPDRQRSASSAQ